MFSSSSKESKTENFKEKEFKNKKIYFGLSKEDNSRNLSYTEKKQQPLHSVLPFRKEQNYTKKTYKTENSLVNDVEKSLKSLDLNKKSFTIEEDKKFKKYNNNVRIKNQNYLFKTGKYENQIKYSTRNEKNNDLNKKEKVFSNKGQTSEKIQPEIVDANKDNFLPKFGENSQLDNVTDDINESSSEINNDIRENLSIDVTKTKNTTWKSLKLRSDVLDVIKKAGFAFPSPVQVESIPHALQGRDILVRSKNGTGKTASYFIPALSKVNKLELTLQVIILVPIRELALQISKNVKKLGDGMGIITAPIVGGTNLREDIIRISNGIHIMVGTPGRVIDLIEKKVVSIGNHISVIFDEADKLLDLTFNVSINKLLGLLPLNRQIMLYSATFPHSVNGFVNGHMKNPVFINLMEELTLVGVKQFYAYVKMKDKLFCLRHILSILNLNQCIIFCNDIKGVELLAMKITEMGHSCYYIHSSMSQSDRNTVFHNFSNKKCQFLVSTDLITRGIDVPNVNCVINFDFPKSSESYIHRVGRTGRFGRTGLSLSLVCDNDKPRMLEIEKKLGIAMYPISSSKLQAFTKKQVT